MNWKAVNSSLLREMAKMRFGDALKIDELSDEEIIEEMEAYDRFLEFKKRGGEWENFWRKL